METASLLEYTDQWAADWLQPLIDKCFPILPFKKDRDHHIWFKIRLYPDEGAEFWPNYGQLESLDRASSPCAHT